jgi:hypothetical protein
VTAEPVVTWNRNLIARADTGAALLQLCYDGKLKSEPKLVTVVDCWNGAWSCEALVVLHRPTVHDLYRKWLLIPGTGYGEGRWKFHTTKDWLRNLYAQIPGSRVVQNAYSTPQTGASKVYKWGKGYLKAADQIDDWLNEKRYGPFAYSAGHSAGGAVLQILKWSRADLGECHAIGSARSCFSGQLTCPGLHVWKASDDTVTSVPVKASHVGTIHDLPTLGKHFGEEHRLWAYRRRYSMVLGD